MKPSPEPPRTASRWARRIVPGDRGRELAAHLDREFARLTAERGRRTAIFWYWRQLLHPDILRLRWTRTVSCDRPPTLLRRWARDTARGARQLRRAPLFTLMCVATLAAGAGAALTVLALVESALIRPWVFDPDGRMVIVRTLHPERGPGGASYQDIAVMGSLRQAFDGAAGMVGQHRNFVGDGPPEQLQGYAVSPGYFELMKARPRLGRLFVDADHDPEGARPIILSSDLWQRRYGGDEAIVGRLLTLSGNAHVVVGIVDSDSVWPRAQPYWLAMDVGPPDPSSWLQRWDTLIFTIVATRAPGVDLRQANAALAVASERIAATRPEEREDVRAFVEPLMTATISPAARRGMLVALAGVIVGLAVTGLNVTGLVLARQIESRGDLALLRALGARSRDLARQSVAQGTILAGIGTALALLIAYGLVGVASALASHAIWFPDELAPGPVVWASAGIFTIVTGIALGALPMRWSAYGVVATRSSGREAVSDRRTTRVRAWLAVGQVALATVVLIAATLMLRTVATLHDHEPGIRTENMLRIDITPMAERRYHTPGAVDRLVDDVRAAVAAAPGVDAVTWALSSPLGSASSREMYEFAADSDPTDVAVALWNPVTPGYFETLDIRLLAGRALGSVDRGDGAPVIVVSKGLATALFGSDDPLGRTVSAIGREDIARTVVGVVADIRHDGLRQEPIPIAYLPTAQARAAYAAPRDLLVRTHGDPLEAVEAISAAVWSVDPNLPLSEVATLRSIAAESIRQERFLAQLLGSFGAAAVALSALGLYGKTAYSVARRRREFGLRLALGAQGHDLLVEVLRGTARLALIGLALGAAGAGLAMRALSSLLYGVEPIDPATYAASMALLLVVVLLACGAPARRAMRTAPADALRRD